LYEETDIGGDFLLASQSIQDYTATSNWWYVVPFWNYLWKSCEIAKFNQSFRAL